jgi:hypothetical protein
LDTRVGESRSSTEKVNGRHTERLKRFGKATESVVEKFMKRMLRAKLQAYILVPDMPLARQGSFPQGRRTEDLNCVGDRAHTQQGLQKLTIDVGRVSSRVCRDEEGRTEFLPIAQPIN